MPPEDVGLFQVELEVGLFQLVPELTGLFQLVPELTELFQLVLDGGLFQLVPELIGLVQLVPELTGLVHFELETGLFQLGSELIGLFHEVGAGGGATLGESSPKMYFMEFHKRLQMDSRCEAAAWALCW